MLDPATFARRHSHVVAGWTAPDERQPHGQPRNQGDDRKRPGQQIQPAARRVQKDPLPVAVHEVRSDLIVGLSGANSRRDRGPHLTGEPRGRIGDGEVQADRAAQAGRDVAGSVGDGSSSGIVASSDDRGADSDDDGNRDQRDSALHDVASDRSASSIVSTSHSYVTAPTILATIVPSGAMTNVSGTPNRPNAIDVRDPGSVTSGQLGPSSSTYSSASGRASSTFTPSTTTPRSRYRSHAASSAPCSSRHGTHHDAQKF